VPEGDTVWLAAKRMHQALAGRALTRADLRVPALATTDLTGRHVHEVLARGKHMLTRLEPDVTLHTHFRMDGTWQLVRAGARWTGGPTHQIRAVLANADWQALGFRLHDIRIVATTDEPSLVGHLGPDLLGPGWDPVEATRRLTADPSRPVGEALHDQRNLAGIGNLYENELLFLAGITPWTTVGDIAAPRPIVNNAHRLMLANRDHPEQSTTGDLGRGNAHWVYQRAGAPCRRCRTPIRTARLGLGNYDRVAFWCPECQHGPVPDGSRKT